MEIDEGWQIGRRYMRISQEENQNSEKNDTLVKEIKQIKEGVNTREELMVS